MRFYFGFQEFFIVDRLALKVFFNISTDIPHNPVNTPWAYIQTKDKFDEPIFGGWGVVGRAYIRGWLIFGKKSTSIFNLLNLLFLLYSSIKHVFRHFSRSAGCEICPKLKQWHKNT